MLGAKKKKLNFFDMLINHGEAVVAAVEALKVFCDDPTEANGDAVKAKETEAASARKLLIDEINANFITPIDREDLFNLSTAVDDLADYAWTTVREVRIYDIVPDDRLKAMVAMLKDMADGLLLCLKLMEKDHTRCADEARKVKKLENALNLKFHQSIAELFNEEDFRKILKFREVYNHMNHASDRADHCADIILDIVVKL